MPLQREVCLGVGLIAIAVLLLVGAMAWLKVSRVEQPLISSVLPGASQPPPSISGETVGERLAGKANDRENMAAASDAKQNSAEQDAVAKQMEELRRRMVAQQLRSRDITDARVLEAMERVPRHRFVPESQWDAAYADHPLPIGHGQTISQPYIVALMTQLAQPKPTSRALDIGTGSGYQAAILAELVKEVYSIEILQPLADSARERLQSLGYQKTVVRCGDGYRGWPEHAPFDVIIVAAAPDHIPQALIDQLAVGGRLVIPIGKFFQNLIVVTKKADGTIQQDNVAPVAFVPMTGEAQQAPPK